MKSADVNFQDFCVFLFASAKDTILNFYVSLQILTLRLNIFACQALFISLRLLQTKRLYSLLCPGLCSSQSLLCLHFEFSRCFQSVCMNAFMIESGRGQYSWRFQVYVAQFSQKRWRRKPDPPLLQAACRKIWNSRNLFLKLSSKVCEINPLGNVDALNRLLLSFWIVRVSSLFFLSLEQLHYWEMWLIIPFAMSVLMKMWSDTIQ